MTMRIGFVGLGKMGGNMVRRLLRSGHQVTAYGRNPEALEFASSLGAEPAASLQELCVHLPAPRAIWMMVPSGAPVEETIAGLLPHLARGDLLIDGGNSHYPDSIRRGKELQAKGIGFLDCGTSGGIWGLELGYCLMVGGDRRQFERVEPVIKSLAPDDTLALVGAPRAAP